MAIASRTNPLFALRRIVYLTIVTDAGAADVDPDSLDALVIPGGYSPDKLRTDDRIVSLTKHMAMADKPVAFICHAGSLLVDAAGKLTGALHNEFIGSVPLQDGMLDGNKVAFKVTFAGPEGSMTINYTGAVNGDELALTSKFEGAPPGGGK